ncbi:prephenate dehydrogenase [Candidatus Nitrosoglobus terrae]|uniref:prephenate dehydrogenase n=1 Tax=Candidatus Nitrosoglobus terrae TaxID=1630141 RepID=A0A1Q2SM69_9GAMM|nr:prephenate dehydrogenase/arogenate dehydrogenase family protein [Candidatus Nitrosoglobus terrae]BAW80238.1 prephenate dehydrogenase [Candidatus Nitrosoglobus terrae]
MIRRLCILGIGLIGGSLALALKQSGGVGEIVGYEQDSVRRSKALALGIVDRIESSLEEALKDADVVVLAVPLSAMEVLFQEMASSLKLGTVVTDVGSVKDSVVTAARARLGDNITYFVPGHPIAGAEKNGPEAATADLFFLHKVILTPLSENCASAVKVVRAMWRQVGAEVIETSASYHDKMLAGTSHLPHVLAYALVDLLTNLGETQEIFQFAAGGFRDFSRTASSDPIVWRDICLANREPLLDLLEQFRAELHRISEAILYSDEAKLVEIFTRAKAARDAHYKV